MKKHIFLFFLMASVFSCENDSKKEDTPQPENTKLFSLISPEKSHVKFNNALVETYEFNFLNYPYIYIGGGVAVGDINNDGLDDIYFTSNQNSNKLYLNKGNFTFEDITQTSGTSDANGWSTGVSMIDINNDGLLDIYVCKSGSLKSNNLRRNKLFINKGNNKFQESAKQFGLDHQGFSTQAYFLDYDNDGDLDMYLVNHRPDFKNNSKIDTKIQNAIFEESSDQLFRNDGAKFTKVSSEAKILNKAWGLSASIGDFNNDGWPDIYVANDYLEPDILYTNNKDGTFTNEVLDRMKHISFNSMGSDYADINNDLKPDLLVLDMLAEDHSRGKENMATMSTSNFNAMVNVGYHHQYMANVLQINNGDGSFSDIGQLAGITKTDWSWAPLIADFDNDGYKDVFITNGIEKDMGNQDFRRNLKELNAQKKAMKLDDVLNMIPADRLPNYIFKNNGDLTFSKKINEWGMDKKVNSNGAAYADFDNDGDLDLVINNENATASIYKNNTANNFISIHLKGPQKNPLGIGSKIKITTDRGSQYQELYLNRGFQSSVTNTINFGLADESVIKNIDVVWPDGSISSLKNVNSNQNLTIDIADASEENVKMNTLSETAFVTIKNQDLGITYKHQENLFDDFSKQLLLPQKQSTQGPCLAVGDINNDGLEDVFIGGAKDQSGEIYIQKNNGSFTKKLIPVFISDKKHEDNGCHFFDADGDKDLDLYITSGGYEFNENDALLQDRLYVNNGKGNFTKSKGLPNMLTSTKAVTSLDFDNDGDQDLVIGGHVIPGKYPLAPTSYILENTNGSFKDATDKVAPEIRNIGMISDIEISDYNNDGSQDIIVVGQWMPITVFTNSNNTFIKETIPELEKTEGWYHSITSADIDNDGDIDYIVGNLGSNNKFHPSIDKPLHIFSKDFDNNGSYDVALSKTYKGQLVPVRGKECSTEQTPFLNDKIATYKEFASLNIEGVYGSENISNAHHLTAYNFKSLYVENTGTGNFKIRYLPNEAQKSPTQDILINDINKDGHLDIIGVGNLYDAEVETIRYDASKGYVLLGDSKGQFQPLLNSGFSIDKDMRAISEIMINGVKHFIIASNNDVLKVFKLKS